MSEHATAGAAYTNTATQTDRQPDGRVACAETENSTVPGNTMQGDPFFRRVSHEDRGPRRV